MAAERELYGQAQRRIIGSLLADSDGIVPVLELINEEDFEEPSYALIFSAMAELARTNTAIAPISVAEELEKRGVLKEAGGPAGLFRLSSEGEGFALDAPPLIYARIVKEASAKSKISRTINESVESFKDDSGVQAADAVSDLQSYLNDQLLKLSDSSTVTDFSQSFSQYLDLLEERKRVSEENRESADGLQGIPTLLPSLNKYTTGWLPGQMITVGARTGVGKSVFAVNCTMAAAKASHSVMFHSLEMSETEIKDRLLSSTTGIPLNKLKQGDLTSDEERILVAQMKDMEKLKIIIDTEPKITVDGIRARAIKQAQTPAGLDLIIVDYLQLVTPNGRFSSRQEAVADMSRNIKLLAKQLGIPIIVLVQLQREKDDDENSVPHLSQIRESGAIAQDSDVVVLLHRDQPLDDTTPHTLVILAKNRGGEANKTIRCHSNLECSLFREITRVKDIEKLTEDDVSDVSDDLDLDDFDDDFSDFDELDL